MKRYLVGGAVRDQLLGLAVKDRDWLVIGTTPEQLLAAGYQQVGRDFPVFLDPVHKEEHALPRAGTDLPEQEQVVADLVRRDLTINAIAQDEQGEYIDPLNGRRDLREKRLRHTPHLFDDPIRILRLARMAARYHGLGFTIAEETIEITRQRIAEGILDHLVPERVWDEIEKALKTERPERFITALQDLHALATVLPEIDRLFGVPQPDEHHPEIDTGIHTQMVLERAAELSDQPVIRFAALTHDLGKGLTPRDRWPRHIAHEVRSARLVDQLCERLRAPERYRRLARLTALHHTQCHQAFKLKPGTLLKLFHQIDAFRRPEDFYACLVACQADAQGRTGFESRPYPQADYLKRLLAACSRIDGQAIARRHTDGHKIRQMIDQERTRMIATAVKKGRKIGTLGD